MGAVEKMQKVNVLVVEDENIVAMDIKNSLERLGYNVPTVAASGEEAINRTMETQPDIILMDIRLKGRFDGIKAAKKIHDQYDIPLIYLTAYADNATVKRAKKTESYGYILKPFGDRELYANIESALYKHNIEMKLNEKLDEIEKLQNASYLEIARMQKELKEYRKIKMLTVDRELKIIELKKEIDCIYKKLGEKPKYGYSE